MKKLFILSSVLVLSCATFGQQIKNNKIELNDFITLLQGSGYELFSYDITDMLNDRYDITFIKKEFETGKEILASNLNMVSNKKLLSDFPEPYRQEFIDDGGIIIDPKTQAITHAEKISIGFYPSINDTTKFMQISVPDIATMNLPLQMKGLSKKDSDKMLYYYNTRPFKLNAFKENEFIPLILFGSYWYDEQFNIYRFCGENEIDPDMSSNILKDIPHYYVIGVKFVKNK